jgi:hypothetical protein
MSNFSTYQYKDPVEFGMTKVSISRKQHNEIFPLRKVHFMQKYHYYIDDNKMTMQCLTSFLGKTYAICIAPLAVIMHGVISYYKEVSDVLNEKEKGKFVEETIFKGKKDGTYEKFADTVGFKHTTTTKGTQNE